jgi:CBS domain-containing protein
MSDVARRDPVMAFADEPLRTVIDRMAETGYTRMPVVDSSEKRRIVGMVSLEDLLRARTRNLAEERSRERILHIRLPFPGAKGSASAAKQEL